MGMFDTIRSSYDLGPGYLNRDLQTKSLDCMMKDYWIDPYGRLFDIDYSHTQSFCKDKPGFKPNGNHGKIRPFYFNGDIEVYPAKWDAHYASYPRCNILFIGGIIKQIKHGQL